MYHSYVRIFFSGPPKILTRDWRFPGKTNGTLNVTIAFYSYPNFTGFELIREDNNSVVFRRNALILTNVLKVKDIFYGQMVSLDGYNLNIIIGNMAPEDFTSHHLYIHNTIGVTRALLQFVAESKIALHYVSYK